MGRSIRGVVLAIAVLAGGASASAAQETGTPIFKAPYRAFDNHEFGASLSDAEGIDYALEGFYRYGRGPNDFSVRGGFADVEGGGDAAVIIGGDFRTRVVSYSESFPLDGSITLGLGGIFGEGDDRFLIPVGVSLGRRFDLENSNTTFVPYAHPVLVPSFGGDDSDVDFALGLGVDIRFSDSFAVRASGGLGDIEGVGISVAYIR
ncbi:MAG TPA: outer membrane beta-barrel protein [Gemmatimonadales bacterium]|nr:outer membrane beta-barrel protein [Gemmatimonadales bacterium]